MLQGIQAVMDPIMRIYAGVVLPGFALRRAAYALRARARALTALRLLRAINVRCTAVIARPLPLLPVVQILLAEGVVM